MSTVAGLGTGTAGFWGRGSPTISPVPPFPQNIVFLGDFNADCAYVKPSDWASIRLRTSDIFKWLIPDSSDTTVGKSDCTYDRSAPPLWSLGPPCSSHPAGRGRSGTHRMFLPRRIVVCGAKLKRSIVPNSATVYNFQRAFQLEQEEVSGDHELGLRVSLLHPELPGAVKPSCPRQLRVQQRHPDTAGLPAFAQD